MNSRKPNEKCLAYLKMKRWIFKKVDTFEEYGWVNNNNNSDIVWYYVRHNAWLATTSVPKKLTDKLNELQRTK